MDREIDREADEEHGEGDRQQVHVPDGEGREAGAPGKSHRQGHERRHHQAGGAETQAQQPGDQGERQQAGGGTADSRALQLLLPHRRLAREAQPRPSLRTDADFARQRPGAGHRGAGRRQAGRIEPWAGENDLARLAVVVDHQAPPREHARPAGDGGLGDMRDAVGQPAQIVAPDLVRLGECPGGDLHQARERGILRQRAEQGFRGGEPVGQPRKRLRLHMEEPVSPQEGMAGRPVDILEVGRGSEPGRQQPRVAGGGLRLGAVDHHHEGAIELGEGLPEGRIVPAEGHVLGDHVGGVGIDAEVAIREIERGGGRRRRQQQYPGGATRDEADPGADQRRPSVRRGILVRRVFNSGRSGHI